MEIYAYKCKKCGHIHYPFRMVCKACGENDFFEFEQVPLPKKGTLLTFTELYSLPADFMVSKMGLGIVELENKVRITGQIAIENARIGMPVVGEVEVVRRGEYDSQYGMVFREA